MKKFIALLLALAMILGLAACGNQGSNVEQKNEIVVGLSQDLGDSLDPYQMSSAGTREILTNVYEGLYKPNSAGEYVPAIADSYEVSEDGLTYVFKIKDNVKFHNGEDLKVADLKYSFATCAETTLDSSLPNFFANASVDVSDKNEITIKLKTPMSDILAFLSLVYIVPADYKDQLTAPVGTGPFKFVSRSVQDNVILEKFEDYYGEKAKLDKVTCKIYEDATAMITALNAGAIDFAAHLTLDQVSGIGNQFVIKEGTMNLVQALYLNNAREPFDDVKVRQALCYAIDKDAILQITADGHGSKLGSSIYPSFKKYFDEKLIDFYPYSPEVAKQMLAEAGYPNGFDMEVIVPSNYTPHVNVGAVIVQQLQAVGINAQLKEVEWNTWLTDVYQGRDFDATVSGFDASTLTANALLERWQTGHKKNMINFSSEMYDGMMAMANASTDEGERTACFKNAAEVLTREAANVYIQDLAEFTAIKKGLEGFEFYPLYKLDFSTIYYAAQ